MSKLDPASLQKINNSKLPQVYKDIFPSMESMCLEKDLDEISSTLTWHDKDIPADDFVPYITIGICKKALWEEKEKERKFNRNPTEIKHETEANKKIAKLKKKKNVK